MVLWALISWVGRNKSLSENHAELNHGSKRIFSVEGKSYLNECMIWVDLRDMTGCCKWRLDRMPVKIWA